MQKAKPATPTENTDVDSSYVAALLEKYGIDPTTKQIAQAEQNIPIQKTKVKAEATLVELSAEKQLETMPSKPPKNRDTIFSDALHPDMGDDHTGNIALAFDWDFYNTTSGETFDGLIFSLSDDFAFITVMSKGFAKKKLVRISRKQKEVLKQITKD